MFKSVKSATAFAALAMTLSACSARVSSNPIEEVRKATPAPQAKGVVATYISDCQRESGFSYRVRVDELASGSLKTSQTMYAMNARCSGYEVSEDGVTSEDVIAKKTDSDTVLVTGNGLSVEATKAESRTFGTDVGLSVIYVGKAGSGTDTKDISSFAEIISQWAGFPLIWTRENGAVVNPQHNPWNWKFSKTSTDYKTTMSKCTKIEDIMVAAGRFRTCVIEANGEKIWYGNVPLYGVIKYEKPDGVEPSYDYFSSIARRAGLPSTAAVSLELSVVGY